MGELTLSWLPCLVSLKEVQLFVLQWLEIRVDLVHNSAEQLGWLVTFQWA